MIAERQLRTFTPKEYLSLECAAKYKSEYIDGQFYEMSSVNSDHSTITVNVMGEIHSQLKSRSCRAYSSDMKVQTGTQSLFSYPDLLKLNRKAHEAALQSKVQLQFCAFRLLSQRPHEPDSLTPVPAYRYTASRVRELRSSFPYVRLLL